MESALNYPAFEIKTKMVDWLRLGMAGNDDQNDRTRFTKSEISTIRAYYQETDLQKLHPDY